MSDFNSNTPQTPEAVAYQLMERILKNTYPSKQEILDTYKECLTLVKNTG